MDPEYAFNIIELIQDADMYNIFFVSLVVIPLLITAWISIFKKLGVSQLNLKRWIYGILTLYITSIAVVKIGTTKEEKLEIASKKIKSYLLARNWELIGFNKARDIDRSYDQKFFEDLIEAYPSEFATVRLEDETDPVGIKYLGNEQVEHERYVKARRKIIDYLKNFPDQERFSGFGKIREYVDSRYDNYFLEELLEMYPDSLQRSQIKDKDDRIGIKLPGN